METVVAILRDKDAKLLLGQRQNTGRRDGSWSLPGSNLLDQETPEKALSRSLREELGIENPIPSSSFELEEGPDTVLHVFVIDRWSGSITNLNTQFCAGFDWFDLSTIPETTPSSRMAINAHIQDDA